MEIETQWQTITSALKDYYLVYTGSSLMSEKILGLTREKLDILTREDPAELANQATYLGNHISAIGEAKDLVETLTQSVKTLSNTIKTSRAEEPKERGRKRKVDAVESKVKRGRSQYNPSEPIVVGSEVAYRLRKGKGGADDEWIQCVVTKVIGDGSKFEVQDPEPDENNQPGQFFRTTYKDLILIPPVSEAGDLPNYPYGTEVLARYPETTTFYKAEVMGMRRDYCRLRFEGEEEVGKETEVERRLVLPLPKK